MSIKKSKKDIIMKYARINNIPEGNSIYDLTEGKIYEIFDYKVNKGGPGFKIIDDVGDIIFCNARHSSHINGGAWDLFEELPETNQPKEKDYAGLDTT